MHEQMPQVQTSRCDKPGKPCFWTSLPTFRVNEVGNEH